MTTMDPKEAGTPRPMLARLLHAVACPRSGDDFTACLHRTVHEGDAARRSDAAVEVLADAVRVMAGRGPLDDTRIDARDLTTEEGPLARPHEWAAAILEALR